MKLLIIGATPYFSNRGCHIRIYEEAKALQQKGVDIELVTYHIGNNTQDIVTHRSKNIPWYNKTDVGSSGKGLFDWKILADILLIFTTASRIVKYKPDYIYGHNQEGFMIGLVAKIITLSRKKVILDAQGSLTQEMITYGSIKKGSMQFKIFRFLESLAYRFAFKIFVSSENMYEFMEKEYSQFIEKTSVLKDSYNSAVLQSSPMNSDEIRLKYRIPKRSIVLLYTGSFTLSKGFDQFFEEIPKLIEKNPDLYIVLAGASRIDHFTKQISDQKLEDRVRIISPLNYFDLAEIITLGDIGIDPKVGTTEASGKLLNYMAGNLPCFAYDCEYNRSLLGNDGNYFTQISEISELINGVEIGRREYDVIKKDSWEKSIQVILDLDKV
jgi:glycosyltransferase involved in cell wall biosynthesis